MDTHFDDFDLEGAHNQDGASTPFRIDSEERAAWVVDKLLSYDERLERLDAQYKRTRARLVADREAFEARFLVPLQQWAGHHLPRRGRTVHLLTGSLSWRTVPATAKVVEAERALAWAEEALPGAVVVTTTKRLDPQALRAYIEAEGEIPPGVGLVEEHDRFYVRAPRKEAADAQD